MKMKGNKRFATLALAVFMGISNVSIPTGIVKAEESAQEYMPLENSDYDYKEFDSVNQDEMISEMNYAEEFMDNSISNMELTASEADELGVTQEYVILAKSDTAFEEVETVYGDKMAAESFESDELADNNIAIVELTEAEVEKLESEQNVLLVEEDILFDASDLASERAAEIEKNWQ